MDITPCQVSDTRGEVDYNNTTSDYTKSPPGPLSPPPPPTHNHLKTGAIQQASLHLPSTSFLPPPQEQRRLSVHFQIPPVVQITDKAVDVDSPINLTEQYIST